MSFSKISLEGQLTVIAGPQPPSDDGFCSDRLQVLHWRVDEPYGDDGTHLHRTSDEVYVVLEGAIDLKSMGRGSWWRLGRRSPSAPASHMLLSPFSTQLGG